MGSGASRPPALPRGDASPRPERRPAVLAMPIRLFANAASAVQHTTRLLLLADDPHRRSATNEAHTRPAAAGPGWSEIFIDASSAAATQTPAEAVMRGHSLLLLQGLASTEECDTLRTEASTFARWRRENPKPYATKDSPKVRSPIDEMFGLAGQALCEVLLRRVLALLRVEHPILLPRLFGGILSSDASAVATNPALTFTPGEPACNVYGAGGEFAPHEDRQSLTILLNLSSIDSFCGGGTAFWSQATADELHGRPVRGHGSPSFVLTPPAGTALVFGGSVTHAARVVVSGERAILVASFSPGAPEQNPAAELGTTGTPGLQWLSALVHGSAGE